MKSLRDVFDVIHDMAATEILQPAHEFRSLTRQRIVEASNAIKLWPTAWEWGCCCWERAAPWRDCWRVWNCPGYRSLAHPLTIPVRDATGQVERSRRPADAFVRVLPSRSWNRRLQSMADRVGTVVQQLQESQLAAVRVHSSSPPWDSLAAGLAHELRNPLTSMKMLVQPADDEADGVRLDARDQVSFGEEIDRLERTIQTFLDYARPPKLEKHPVVIRDILGQTVDFVARRAQQLGITFEPELPEQVVEVEADAGQIRQVLLNLLLNAMDAAPEGDSGNRSYVIRAGRQFRGCPALRSLLG